VRPARVRWKPAILAFLRARSEAGALQCEIAEHCVNLISAGTLNTAAPADDRPRVVRNLLINLWALKRAGEVVRRPDKAYVATARGLAWLKRHPCPSAEILPHHEVAPGGCPGPTGRTIAIGDIHGCSAALRALLGAVGPEQRDTVVTLGNCIDHGPDSQGVVRLLLDLVGHCTLVPLKGDHEEKFLDALEGRDDYRAWQQAGGGQTLRSYGINHPRDMPRLHLTFLNSFQEHYETATHLFVHAGYQEEVPLHGQSGAVLRRASPDAERPGRHMSGKVAVVGHTPQRSGEPLDLGHLICIDTHCHAGGWLTALDVGTGRWWQANEQGQVREGKLGRPDAEPPSVGTSARCLTST
jgi:serine/threonine protein phosphatase 1